MERLAKYLFVVAVAILAVTYGIFAAPRGWFPQPQIALAEQTLRDFALYWRNDLGLAPSRHLVPAEDPERPVFRMLRPDLAPPGMVLIAGLSPGRATLQGATLYDREGRELHHWAIDYSLLDPEGLAERNVLLHGIMAFADGSLAVAFDAGNVIARVDACGKPLWVTEGGFHHAISRDDDGAIWSWRKETLVQLDAETGAVQREIDLQKDVVEAQDLHGILSIHTVENQDGLKYGEDAFHTNDVEPLRQAMADAFPGFAAGDLLFSLRSLNFVAVMDPTTKRLKWWRHGPWFRQHDPDFEPDGRISIYDNRMGLGVSQIVAIDPATNRLDVLLGDDDEARFYSWRRGKHQRLADGALLVTESERGRVFLASAAGELVWERNMIFDEVHNYIVTSATHLPEGYFADGALDCAGA